jgi:hypothetical protein
MIAVVSILVFAGAFALSAGLIAMAIGPQWRRIVNLAMGRVEQSFAPLEQLAQAERRIAVRRWASAPIPMPITRLRGAA